MYLAGPDDEEPEPGSPEFGQRAAQRRASIWSTPLPTTSGPSWLFLPAQALGRGVSTAVGSATEGLAKGLGPMLTIGGLALAGLYLWRRR